MNQQRKYHYISINIICATFSKSYICCVFFLFSACGGVFVREPLISWVLWCHQRRRRRCSVYFFAARTSHVNYIELKWYFFVRAVHYQCCFQAENFSAFTFIFNSLTKKQKQNPIRRLHKNRKFSMCSSDDVCVLLKNDGFFKKKTRK